MNLQHFSLRDTSHLIRNDNIISDTISKLFINALHIILIIFMSYFGILKRIRDEVNRPCGINLMQLY